jgi:actin-related protein
MNILMGGMPAPIVIDSGSCRLKAGFAGLNQPKLLVETRPGAMCGGYVSDWRRMEKEWKRLVRGLTADAARHPVLLTEPVFSSVENRCRKAEILLEGVGAPAFFAHSSSVLTLFSAGLTSGCTLESGDALTDAVPVFEGYPLMEGVQRLTLSGAGLTAWLRALVIEQGYRPETLKPQGLVGDIKRRSCFVALHYGRTLEQCKGNPGSCAQEHTLPDSTRITLDAPRFRCPEALFDAEVAAEAAAAAEGRTRDPESTSTPETHFQGYDLLPDVRPGGKSFPRTVQEAVARASACARDHMGLTPAVVDVVLGGGSTLFKGFAERLAWELGRDRAIVRDRRRTPDGSMASLHVVAARNRHLSAWVGGSVLASTSSCADMWISRAEWEESGERVVLRKCFP